MLLARRPGHRLGASQGIRSSSDVYLHDFGDHDYGILDPHESNKHNMYTLIDDVMSLADCKANATFYSMTKDCWTSLSPKSQKAWDLLLKQEKMRILNDAMTRSTKPASDSKQWSANTHEQEEAKSPKIEANVHDSKEAPVRKPILKPAIKQQANHANCMGIVDLLDTPNPSVEDSPGELPKDSVTTDGGFNINTMLQCKSRTKRETNVHKRSFSRSKHTHECYMGQFDFSSYHCSFDFWNAPNQPLHSCFWLPVVSQHSFDLFLLP
jgi:hypothetical protein